MRAKPRGLMPNQAVKQLFASMDADIANSVGEAVRAGIVRPEQAELTRTRVHFARVDKWFAMMDRLSEKK